jgi:hypothetical protein
MLIPIAHACFRTMDGTPFTSSIREYREQNAPVAEPGASAHP